MHTSTQQIGNGPCQRTKHAKHGAEKQESKRRGGFQRKNFNDGNRDNREGNRHFNSHSRGYKWEKNI